MLSAAHRLRASTDFTDVVKHGRRAGRPRVTVHVLTSESSAPARAGLVVGKVVGNAVVRHQVSRRLRHLLRDRVEALPTGSRLVVRACAPAGSSSSAELAVDLDGALKTALSKVAR